MIPPAFIAGGVALVLAGLLLAECQTSASKDTVIQAKQDEIDKTWKVENQALAAKLEIANGEVNSCHVQIDAIDAQARAAKATQQKQVQELNTKLNAATAERDALFAGYQEEIDARPETVTKLVGAPVGWDPVVASSMCALRREQLRDAGAGSAGDIPDYCLSDRHDTRGSGLAGDPAGTAGAYPRPSAQQQLDFSNFAWKLRAWGKSCYDDKRAIAASQAP